MKFGICVPISRIAESFPNADFQELPAREIYKMEKPVFQDIYDQVKDGRRNIYSANCLTPNEMRLTGPEVDMQAIREYARVTFDRLAQLQISTVVFGAGRSKSVPEGFAQEAAWDQLYELGSFFADTAAQYGQTLVIEPLSYTETNIINTVAEAAEYAKTLGRSNCKYLVDFYHYISNGEKLEDLAAFSQGLVHAHIATAVKRSAPQDAQDWDFFRQCIRTLKDMGYTGGLTYEGKFPENANEMLRIMKTLDA